MKQNLAVTFSLSVCLRVLFMYHAELVLQKRQELRLCNTCKTFLRCPFVCINRVVLFVGTSVTSVLVNQIYHFRVGGITDTAYVAGICCSKMLEII